MLKNSNNLGLKVKYNPGTRDFIKKQMLYKLATEMLKIKDYEVVVTNITISEKKGYINFKTDEKYKIDKGAKVKVIFKKQEIEDEISAIDFEFKILKINKTKNVPYAFDNVKFLETLPIK